MDTDTAVEELLPPDMMDIIEEQVIRELVDAMPSIERLHQAQEEGRLAPESDLALINTIVSDITYWRATRMRMLKNDVQLAG